MNSRAVFHTVPALLLTLAPVIGIAAPSTGTPFYGDPPDDHHPWAIHDRNRPQPMLVSPGTFSSADVPGQPPSDAIVLFNGTVDSLSNWEADPKEGQPEGPTKWIVKDGAMECVPKSGYIRTKRHFGDCQLHVEWAAPKAVVGDSQGRGNSGIFLMGLVEVQVLDNYDNPTYADGFAASVYGVNPPQANALRPPGEFQVIDIVFRRPLYQGSTVVDPGYLTVFCNGVLVQDHTPLEGPTGHKKRTAGKAFPEKGPLKLQDHGNPVRFRNIWYRALPPRSAEGGTDGILNAKATQAKRAEIAASIRTDAKSMKEGSTSQMLRLAESLVYQPDIATQRRVEQWATEYASRTRMLTGPELEKKKGEVKQVIAALQYLSKLPAWSASSGSQTTLEEVSRKAGWDDEKK